MVAWAVVEWDKKATRIDRIDELEDDDDGHFYAVLAARKDGRSGWLTPTRASLLYLGLAFAQPVQRRIKQDHASYRLLATYARTRAKDRELIVVVGWLPQDAYSTGRVTKQFAEDVESLLIYENQPKFNKRHKRSYAGRPLVVVSAGGYKPLKMFAESSPAAFAKWDAAGGMADAAPWLSD